MKVVKSKVTELDIAVESRDGDADCKILDKGIRMAYQLDLTFMFYKCGNQIIMVFNGKKEKINELHDFYDKEKTQYSRGK